MRTRPRVRKIAARRESRVEATATGGPSHRIGGRCVSRVEGASAPARISHKIAARCESRVEATAYAKLQLPKVRPAIRGEGP